MEIQLAVAGTAKDAENFKADLVAQGYVLKQRVDDDGKPDEAAYKTFKDSTGAIRAQLRMEFYGENNVEFNGRAQIHIGQPNETTAYWFSVHRSNVTDKLKVFDELMTQLYGPANQ